MEYQFVNEQNKNNGFHYETIFGTVLIPFQPDSSKREDFDKLADKFLNETNSDKGGIEKQKMDLF